MSALNTNNSLEENIAYSRSEVFKYNLRWVITNFSFYPEKNQKYVESAIFLIDTVKGMRQWKLRVHPNLEDTDGINYVAIYVTLNLEFDPFSGYNNFGLSDNIKYKMTIMNSENNKSYTRESIEAANQSESNYCVGFGNFIDRNYLMDKKNGLLPNDTLTILCEIFLLSDIKTECVVSNSIKITKCTFQEDLSKLFENDEYSDLILSANGKEFKVHKNVLGTRSSVFAAMFRNNVKKNLSIVKIDINQAVLKEMLRYIYTGEVENLKELAFDLLHAANKYELPRLKSMCEEEISKNISTKNAADVLRVADLYRADQLKIQVNNFRIG